MLTVGKFDVPETPSEDFYYLFSENGTVMETKYCYWNHPKQEIREMELRDM
jgi:hypothetical protein